METSPLLVLRNLWRQLRVEPEYMVVTIRGLKLMVENPKVRAAVKDPDWSGGRCTSDGVERGFGAVVRGKILEVRTMRKWVSLVVNVLVTVVGLMAPVLAQASTRNVVTTWTASSSASVTGYSVFRCTVPAGQTSCTPDPTLAPIGTATTNTYTDQTAQVGQAYEYGIVANAPACTSTTPLTTPCGNSAQVVSGYVPVPPNTAGPSNIVVVVP